MCFVLLSTEASCLLLSSVLICTYLPSNESDACRRWVRITRALRRYHNPSPFGESVLLWMFVPCSALQHVRVPLFHTSTSHFGAAHSQRSARVVSKTNRSGTPDPSPTAITFVFRASCAAFVSKGGELRQHGRRGWCRRGPWHSVRRVTVMWF